MVKVNVMPSEKIIEILGALGLDISGECVTKVVITFEVAETPTVVVHRFMPNVDIDFMKLRNFIITERTARIGDGQP